MNHLSKRATNILKALNIQTVAQLANADPRILSNARGIGPDALREFIACVYRHTFQAPAWLPELRPNIRPTAAPEGYRPLTNAYASHERGYLEMAIATLGPIPWALVETEGGCVELWREGGVEVEEVEE